MNKKEQTPLVFEYVNWQGEKAIRRVKPLKLWFGTSEFHPQAGKAWFLVALDLDKNAERKFLVTDIIKFIKEE
jgi:predicted DNA-binding transcriptional regulator YafY